MVREWEIVVVVRRSGSEQVFRAMDAEKRKGLLVVVR